METDKSHIVGQSAQGGNVKHVCACLGVTALFTIIGFCLAIAAYDLGSSNEDTIKALKDELLYLNENIVSASATSPEGFELVGSLAAGTGEWVTKPSLPEESSDLQAVAIDTKIYILGGLDSGSDEPVMSQNVVFDSIFESYAQLTDMPTPRFRFAAEAIGTKIYVVGGYATYNETDGPLATMDIYDTESGEWESGPEMPGGGRSDLSSAQMGDVLYVFGGYDVTYAALDATLKYDPSTQEWSTVAAMPTRRGDIVAVSFGEEIYVLGGWTDIHYGFTDAVESYNPSSDSWTNHTSLPRAKGDKAAAVYQGHLFQFGGEVWSGETAMCPWGPCDVNEIPLHDCHSFTPETEVWVAKAPLPGAVFRFGAAVANDAIFVFGGHSEGERSVSSVFAYYDVEHPDLFVHRRASE